MPTCGHAMHSVSVNCMLACMHRPGSRQLCPPSCAPLSLRAHHAMHSVSMHASPRERCPLGCAPHVLRPTHCGAEVLPLCDLQLASLVDHQPHRPAEDLHLGVEQREVHAWLRYVHCERGSDGVALPLPQEQRRERASSAIARTMVVPDLQDDRGARVADDAVGELGALGPPSIDQHLALRDLQR